MMEKNFETFYEELSPVVGALEQKRKELKAKGEKKGLMYGLILFVLCTGLLCLLLGGFSWWALLIALAVSAFVFYSCVQSQGKELTLFYKEHIISRLADTIHEGMKYEPDAGISQSAFNDCGLFTSPDRYNCEDMFSGRVDKTEFVFSEVHAEQKHVTNDSKGRRKETWETIFRGFLFIADFNKDFSGHTTVLHNSLFKFSGKRVKLENPEFEKRFDVFSTDAVEARYLLSPSMMERLMETDKRFPGKITVSFHASNVIVAIPDMRNHFEVSIWNTALNPNMVKTEYDTINALLEIIGVMELNTRIWTKV